MQDYQTSSYATQITFRIDWLALPLSHADCIIEADFRKALHEDILSSIDCLYDLSAIDSEEKERLLSQLSNAYIHGGL